MSEISSNPTYRVLSFTEAESSVQPATLKKVETDEEIIDRFRVRFSILESMTHAVKRGDVRAMIVSGAPGVGKSFGVEKVLSGYELLGSLANDPKFKGFEIVKGTISPLGLYMKLHEYRHEKNILVFDDCDSILLDDTTLNILKAALDTSRRRTISWGTNTRILEDNDIPRSFDFQGGVIFITNINFSNIKSKKLQDHLEALESRCHYIDLTIHSQREKMLRIRQIIKDGMLDSYDFTQDQHNELINFITSNQNKLRELSLRTIIKAADLMRSFGPDRWQSVAEITLTK